MNTKLFLLSFSIAGLMLSACATTGTQTRDSMSSAEYNEIEVMPARKLTKKEAAIVSDTEVEEDMRKKIALSRLDGNEIICKKEKKTGTRLGAKRVCKTKTQWELIKEEARKSARDLQNSTQIRPES